MHEVELLDDGRVKITEYSRGRNGKVRYFTIDFKDIESYKSMMQGEYKDGLEFIS